MSWRHEFNHRDAEFDVPESIIRMEGLEDMSWHNDTCPSFGTTVIDGALDLRIWCEAVDPDERQSGMPTRFAVNAGVWSGEAWDVLRAAGLEHITEEFPPPAHPPVPSFETDDPHEAVRIFITVLAHIQAAITATERRAA